MMPRRVVFFPHSDQFVDEYHLRDWLAGSLRLDREAIYRLKEATGLGDLQKGSLVFFLKNHLIVGFALVDESVREITSEDRDKYGWNTAEDREFKKLVRFVPETICALPDERFIRADEVTAIIHKGFGQGYTTIGNDEEDDRLDQLLQIFALL